MHRNDEFPQQFSTAKVAIDLSSYPASHGQAIERSDEFDLTSLALSWGPTVLDAVYLGAMLFMIDLHKTHNRPANPSFVMMSQDIAQDLRSRRRQKWALDEALKEHVGKSFLYQDIVRDGWVAEKEQRENLLNVWLVALNQLRVICFSEEDAMTVQKNLNQWAQNHSSLELLTQIPYRIVDTVPRGEPHVPMLIITLEDPNIAFAKKILTSMLSEHNQMRAAIIERIESDAKLHEFFKFLINKRFGMSTASSISSLNLDNAKLLILCQDYMLLSVARNQNDGFNYLLNQYLHLNKRMLEIGDELALNKKIFMAHEQQFNAEISHILSNRISEELQQPVKQYIEKKITEINALSNEGLSITQVMEKRDELLSILKDIDYLDMRKFCKNDSSAPKSSSLFSPEPKGGIDLKKIDVYLDAKLRILTQQRSPAAAAARP